MLTLFDLAADPADLSGLSDAELAGILSGLAPSTTASLTRECGPKFWVNAHPVEVEGTMTADDLRRIQAGIELGRRVAAAVTAEPPATLTGTASAIAFCRQHFRRLAEDGQREEFHVVLLNTRHDVIGTHRVSVGTLDSALVHPRETFRAAMRANAAAVLLVHNHPSGDPSPSPEDHAVTRRLEAAGRTLGIDVIDHVIVASRGTASLRASG